MRRAFKYRLFTNTNQERELASTLESQRRLYNACLDLKQLAFEQYGVTVTYSDCSRWFTHQRKTNPFFASLNFSSAQKTLRRLFRAFDNFFRRCKEGASEKGFPRFKGRNFFNSIEFTYRDGIRLIGNRLRVQHIGIIRLKLHRPVEGVIKTATLKREAGKWFVVFSCELPDVPVAPSDLPPVGIDVGLTHFLTTSTGEEVQNPRYLKDALPKLRRAGRSVSRKKKGGSNRRKAVKKLQKVHARVKNLRREHHQQAARKLVRRHGFIAVESLNIQGMVRNGRLARSISDVAWGNFLDVLYSQAAKAGVRFVAVDPKGTSQTCVCGHPVPKDFSQRWHSCPACGLEQKRDHVSARVILARGLLEAARIAPTGANVSHKAKRPLRSRSRSRDGVITSPRTSIIVRRLIACLLLLLLPALGVSQHNPGKQPPKSPVPDMAALKSADKLVLRVFGKDLEAAKKDRKARLKLIAVLLDNAREAQEEVALRYLLYRKSLDLAAQSGELSLALEIAHKLRKGFDLDGDALVTTVFEHTQPAVTTAAGQRHLCQGVLEFQDELLDLSVQERGRYDLVVRLAKTAEAAAAKAADETLQSEVSKRVAEVRFLAKEYERIQPALTTLKEKPADAHANLEVGKFYALVRGDWPRGLPLLAQGPEGKLKALAQLELSQPKTVQSFMEMAAGWQQLANKGTQPLQVRMLVRAAHYYQQAALHATGKIREQAEANLKEVEALLAPDFRLGSIRGLVRRLEGHQGPVMAVALSADGQRALTGSSDKTVRLWDLKTGKEVLRLEGHPSWVRAVRFSPDGTQALSAGDDDTLRLWDLAKGTVVHVFKNPKGWVRCLAYLPDGTRFVAGGDDRVVSLWEVASGRVLRTFRGHTGFVLSVALSKNGKLLLSGSTDFMARLWDVDTGTELKRLEGHKGIVTGVALTPDGKRALTTSADGTVRCWDVAEGKELHRFEGHQGTVWCVALTADGKQALTGGADKTLRLWDVASGREMRRFAEHTEAVVSVTVGLRGRVALTGSMDKTALLWGESAK